jgi:hypothetical protein
MPTSASARAWGRISVAHDRAGSARTPDGSPRVTARASSTLELAGGRPRRRRRSGIRHGAAVTSGQSASGEASSSSSWRTTRSTSLRAEVLSGRQPPAEVLDSLVERPRHRSPAREQRGSRGRRRDRLQPGQIQIANLRSIARIDDPVLERARRLCGQGRFDLSDQQRSRHAIRRAQQGSGRFAVQTGAQRPELAHLRRARRRGFVGHPVVVVTIAKHGGLDRIGRQVDSPELRRQVGERGRGARVAPGHRHRRGDGRDGRRTRMTTGRQQAAQERETRE